MLWHPMKPRITLLAVLLSCLVVTARDLTFFHVSDTHYGLSAPGDAAMTRLVEKMNALPGTAYPTNLGGTVGEPRGVVHTGDLTNDSKPEQWAAWVRDYGLDGTDGKLRWPVYETFGNHDGGSNRVVRAGIRERNRKRVGIDTISPGNGIHYAWEWDGIRFIVLGVSPGTRLKTYDPEDSLLFLQDELAKKVKPGQPVFLMQHFGFDKGHSLNWWTNDARVAYAAAIKDVNVLGILQGHAHESFFMQWEGHDVYHPPHFRQKKPPESGEVSHGFYVFHITDDELTVAERRLNDAWGPTQRKTIARKP